MCFAMKMTEEKLKCLADAAEILNDIHEWTRESLGHEGDFYLEAMSGAGVLVIAGVLPHAARMVNKDTASKFKTPYPNVSTRWVSNGEEEEGKTRSFGDEGP